MYAKTATETIMPNTLRALNIPSYNPPKPDRISPKKANLSIQLRPSFGVSKNGSLFGSSLPFPTILLFASPKVKSLNSNSTSPPVS